jgi:CubicO group peptidase (beta-lactamase class C family)
MKPGYLILLLVAAMAAPCQAQSTWPQYDNVTEAGYDPEMLDAIREQADEYQVGALMIVQSGHAVAAWGDVQRKFRMHSMRKSLVSALIGITVSDGTLRLSDTLRDLGIDDAVNPLRDSELDATLEDVISARSGVYLPAAYAPPGQDENRPERGAFAPGTHWFYNNWDFNVAGVIYETATEMDLYQAFDELIAHPIGMEDYHPRDGTLFFEPRNSEHPAQTFRMSTRDLARFGQLYLNHGEWNGRKVVPADWVETSTATHSDLGGRNYGYMWWNYDVDNLGSDFRYADAYRAFLARGLGGHGIVVYPDLDLVIVIRADTDHNRRLGARQVWGLIDGIIEARISDPDPSAATHPLQPVPFDSQLPDDRPLLDDLTSDEKQALRGTYETDDGMNIDFFGFDGDIYIDMPGRGQAKLYRIRDSDVFTIRVVTGVRIAAERGDDGRFSTVDIRQGDMRIRARRVE